MMLNNLFKITILLIISLLFWQTIILIGNLPPYILPTPKEVFTVYYSQYFLLLQQSIPTLIEIFSGFILGVLFGIIATLIVYVIKPLGKWLLPTMIASQAIPTFAIAPLLVLWFGYGYAAKIITIMLMIFFPVSSAFYDGLNRIPKNLLEQIKLMQAKPLRTMFFVKIPYALPHLATGIRLAAVLSPIGAIISEWVGASQGLGFLMLNANARLQIDVMFAALGMIVFITLLLYFIVDYILRYYINWE